MKAEEELKYFDLENEKLIFTQNGAKIFNQIKGDRYWSSRWMETEEFAKEVFEEIKKNIGDRAIYYEYWKK